MPSDKDNTRENTTGIDLYGWDRPRISYDPLQSGIQTFLLCLALFLMVVGARWWLIHSFGSDIPIWDQWDAEAANLYKRYYEGTLSVRDLFAPHNEHRIFFTRILALGLTIINGQWDPRLQMIVNSIVYAIVPSALFLIFSREQSIRYALLCCGGLAVIFTFPFGWENTLGGFQSQFYFLIAFSLAAIFLLLNTSLGPWSWFGGAAFGAAALFSMGSGLLAPLAVLGVLALRIIREWPAWRFVIRGGSLITIMTAAIVIGAGILLTANSGGFESLKIQSSVLHFRSFIACLRWPCRPLELWVLFSWVPFIFFLRAYMARRAEDGLRERFLIGMGLWVILQAAAIAFARPGDAHSSRYADLLSFGLIVNSLSAAWLFAAGYKYDRLMKYLLLLWVFVSAVTLFQVSFDGDVENAKQSRQSQRSRTASFVATDDFRYLAGTSPAEIPYPDPKRLAEILQDPAILLILPNGIQKPLSMVPAQNSPHVIYKTSVGVGLDLTSSQLWDEIESFSRVVVINSPERFEYRIAKQKGLPFVFFSFSGNKKNVSLSVFDSHASRHRVFHLYPDSWLWNHAVSYCPSMDCSLVGSTDTPGIVLLEPKEIGLFSIAAMIAGQWGRRYIFGIGVTLFSLLLISYMVRSRQ